MADVEDSMALLEEGLSLSSMSSSSDVSSDEADPALAFGPDLFIDDEDRTNLMAMPELQREEILLRRKEMLDKSKERREAQAKWRLEQRRQRRERIQESEAPVSTRAKRQKKAETSKEKAIQDIRGRRNKQIRARQSEIIREHGTDEDESWNEDEGNESNDDNYENDLGCDRRLTSSPIRDASFDPVSIRSDANNPIDHETMRSVQLRRDRIEALVDEPFFEDIIRGMFCRIGLGTNDATGEHVYRAVIIVGVVDYPRTYLCGTKETCKALKVAFGGSERTFKISQVSNHGIAMNEAGQWLRAQQNDGLAIPTIGQCITIKLAAEKLRRTFMYTPEMVDEMVQRKTALRAGKSHNVTQQKFILQRDLQLAIESGDKKRQVEIENKLDAMQEYIRTLKRRQDNSVETLNMKIRHANKMIDVQSDRIAARLKATEPVVRRRSSTSAPLSLTPELSLDAEDSVPMRLECKVMNRALRSLAKWHDIPFQTDIRASPSSTVKSSYLDLYPNAARVPKQYSDRTQFENTLSLKEWRRLRGLE